MLEEYEEGLFSDEIEERPKKKKREEIVITPVSTSSKVEIGDSINYVISNCSERKLVDWLNKHKTGDAFRDFLLASMVAPYTNKGIIGFIKTYAAEDLIKWVVTVNNEYHDGQSLRFVANLGKKIIPFPLMAVAERIVL